MAGIIKTVIRFGVIAGVVVGGAALIAGPDRIGALASQVKQEVTDAIDDNIDDPVALRRQLTRLEKEYPKRIAQVRSDLAELGGQIRELEREKAIAERVVVLAHDDVENFRSRLDSWKVESSAQAASLHRINGYTPTRLESRIAQAGQVAVAYANQAEDAERDLGYLYQQAERLEQLLAQLETERSQFQAQLMQLERQVDAVARNERLIELMGKRQRTIEEFSRYEVVSLDHIQSRLDGIRNRQEAELQALASTQSQVSYEDRAKLEIEMGDAPPHAEAMSLAPGVSIQVIPAF